MRSCVSAARSWGQTTGQAVAASPVLLSWDAPRLCHRELVQNQLGAAHASCGAAWDETTDILASGISRLCVSPLWPAAGSKPRPVGKLASTPLGAKSLQDGLAASMLRTLEWAASVESGCTSRGTCPPRLCLVLLPDTGLRLEPRVSRPAQHQCHMHPGAVQDKPCTPCGGTFLRLLLLGFPPAVLLLYSHITEGTKGQAMFRASFLC